MPRASDTLTGDLFQVPITQAPTPGSLNFDSELRAALSNMLKRSPHGRYQVASRMSELVGHEITKEQLDAWTAESKKPWRFPFEYSAAFECACECGNGLQELLARKRGTTILLGDDALFAELGHINAERSALAEREKNIKRFLAEKKKK